jgi:hypothetical protein
MRRPSPKINFDPNTMTPIRGNNQAPRIQISPPRPFRGPRGVADRINAPSRLDDLDFQMQMPTFSGGLSGFLPQMAAQQMAQLMPASNIGQEQQMAALQMAEPFGQQEQQMAALQSLPPVSFPQMAAPQMATTIEQEQQMAAPIGQEQQMAQLMPASNIGQELPPPSIEQRPPSIEQRPPSIEQMPLPIEQEQQMAQLSAPNKLPTPSSFQPTQEMLRSMNPDIGGGNTPFGTVIDRPPTDVREPNPFLNALDDRGVPIFGGKDSMGDRLGLQLPPTTDLTDFRTLPYEPSGPSPFPTVPFPRTDGMIGDLPPDVVSPPVSPPAPEVIPPAPQVSPPAPQVSPPAPVDTSPTETTPAPDIAPETTGTGTGTAPATSGGGAPAPFAAGVKQVSTKLDPLTEQLLFGIGGKGGFIPGAMRAAEKTFYDDQGNPIVIDEKVAGFSPDQLAAMQMQRQSLGMQDPYLQEAAGAYGAGTQALEEGLQRGRTAAIGSLAATRGGVGSLQQGLGESADILRGTIGGYDPSMTDRFYDPYEDRVVQQTISDIMERGAQGDVAARAGDIARGGESAFGSRARLGASERQEALGRGLAEAVSGIRSRGFSEAQRTGLGEFARQRGAERAASAGLAGLAGQGFGGSQALAGALSGLGGTEQQIGQQRYSGQFGLGSSLQGLGAQAAGASASDIAALYGMGGQQQGQAQRMLDAQRRNLQQRQMTPLLQYQALQPFVSMAPAGQFQTITDFAPKPSATQIGIGTGLSTFGALGNLYGGGS